MTTTLIGDRQTSVPSPRHLDLDVAAVARTKGEIAALVAEMGLLAANATDPQAFYPAMLARLTTAMGGSGAALWQLHPEDDWNLLCSQTLPVSLANGRHPSAPHLRILQRVAREHLDPAKMAILVVGDWDEIAKGDLDKRATMNDFFGGAVKHLPLRDPLTLEPLPAP